MATFKACVRSQRSDGLFAVLIRVTHNRVARYINTDKTVDKSKLRKGKLKTLKYFLIVPTLLNSIVID